MQRILLDTKKQNKNAMRKRKRERKCVYFYENGVLSMTNGPLYNITFWPVLMCIEWSALRPLHITKGTFIFIIGIVSMYSTRKKGSESQISKWVISFKQKMLGWPCSLFLFSLKYYKCLSMFFSIFIIMNNNKVYTISEFIKWSYSMKKKFY